MKENPFTRLRSTSASDPILPLMEELWDKLQQEEKVLSAIRESSQSVANDGQSLRATRNKFFVIGWLVFFSVGAATGGVAVTAWDQSHDPLKPLRSLGVQVRVTEEQENVQLRIRGRKIKSSQAIRNQSKELTGIILEYTTEDR